MTEQKLTEQEIAAKGRALEEAPWQLPKRYRLQAEMLALPPEELKKQDPEMYALWQRVQEDEKRLAASMAMPFGQTSSQDQYRARAVQRAEEHRATIESLDQQISEVAFGSGEGNLAELQAAKIAIKHRRAEQLAIAGRYDLAASEEPDPAYRDHYMAILDAVFRDDEDHCGCPPVQGSGEFASTSVPSWNAKEDIFSIKLGRMVTLMKCSSCPFMNAIDTPAHVTEQRAHRARAMAIAGKMTPEDAARALSARGHTTANLLSKKK